jgi:hypothetical protein
MAVTNMMAPTISRTIPNGITDFSELFDDCEGTLESLLGNANKLSKYRREVYLWKVDDGSTIWPAARV